MVCRNSLDGEHDNIHSTSNKNNLSNGRDKESSLSGLPRMKNVIDLDEIAGEGDETAGDRYIRFINEFICCIVLLVCYLNARYVKLLAVAVCFIKL